MDLPAPGSLFLNPVLVIAAVIAVGYPAARLWRARLPQRERRWRWAALVSAAALLAGACFSPLGTLGAHYLLTAHLLQNLLLMGCVPPLLLLALPPQLASSDGRWARWRWLVHPVIGLLLFNAAFLAWHASALFEASLHSETVYAIQQATLLVAGVAFWWPIAGPTRPSTMLGLMKLGYILLATIPQTFTGLMFALARVPFYKGYAAAPRLGMSVLVDQQVAGACLALASKIALFIAFSVVLWRVLSEGTDDQDGDDDRGDRGRDAPSPVPGLPAWVRQAAAGHTVQEPAGRRRRPAPVRRDAEPERQTV